MRSIKWFHVLVLILVLFNTRTGLAAVILQYHHVSEKLPAVTSVSEATFRQHLNFLKSEQFSVIALDELIQQLQAGKTLPPKTVAITFDDGYLNNMEAAAPILEQFGYPYTIFVNPKLIDEKKGYVMSWPQLRQLSKRGALIANHSAQHDYLHLKKAGESQAQWRSRIRQDLVWSQARIKEEIGHDLPYIAYPYGEFDRPLQDLVAELGLVGIGQHSGAVGPDSDFTRLPRFPASGIYANLSTLKTKLYSLAFSLAKADYQDSVTDNRTPSITLTFKEMDFYQNQFACFVSGLGKADLTWQGEKTVTITTPKPLSSGRSRYNCTAPSKRFSGQFYWYSQPWVVTDASQH
ncbi:polysaccharide deacetylase [Pseudoalteromonas rubra]|uniref:Polysaccharide deacetylase n=1 Tax=Pseudoalteromonas rubra TaxID=43658 RepID=A0A5S3WHE0_9GAMM|nr:polysaccharide deacetylase family protein [Pseudoalteromonas rubra]TMP25273.1 polysaccharide deacetylase [Pseudoalteromonas rubra]TMP32271.1 polysaccharide deacetylase [Pseudoalteromonas rubra]